MVAVRSTRKGFFSLVLGTKPVKPSARGNAAAFKAGAKAFKASNGPTPELERVVMMALKNDALLKR